MKKRETNLDMLRIFALLLVIMVHVCGMQIDTLPSSDGNWQILVLLRSLVTWEVPVYIMISGRFFLDPERNITFPKIGKSILRLVLAFILWNIFYQLYYFVVGAYEGLNWKGMLSEAVAGPYHFWYLWMLIAMYAITPFLRKITQDKKLMEYFILLYLAFQFLTKYGPELPFVGTTISVVLEKVNFHFTLGYSGYYVLGYYLYKHPISVKGEMLLYILGAVLLLAGAGANVYRSIHEGIEDVWYTQYLLPNIVIVSAAVYTFAVKRLSKIRIPERLVGWISTLSEYSFGVYLVHALTIEFFARAGLTPMLLHPLIMVPAFTVLVYAASHLWAFLLRKVPLIGRHMT